MTDLPLSPDLLIIGGGPAGLMAAEVVAQAGHSVLVVDAMPSLGRKFLLAGIGGMNITHSEPLAPFCQRYREAEAWVTPWLTAFDNQALRDWIHALGVETFVGSSGRVFPRDMKAAPLLRAWLHRLRDSGVQFAVRSRWLGWNAQGQLRIAHADGERHYSPRATLLALGGASWPRLGSDGSWQPLLHERGVELRSLRPANCGFEVDHWRPEFRQQQAGQPIKAVRAWCHGGEPRRGELMLTADGVEGSLIYALSAALRAELEAQGQATLWLDLAPERDPATLQRNLAKPRGKNSLSNHLRKQAGLDNTRLALLREQLDRDTYQQADPIALAQAIKALPIRLARTRPIDEAISSAGGIAQQACNERLMLKALPGVFCAGEMLDWEAPTGGYLLTACFASGRIAGQGVREWLTPSRTPD